MMDHIPGVWFRKTAHGDQHVVINATQTASQSIFVPIDHSRKQTPLDLRGCFAFPDSFRSNVAKAGLL